jgi:uroporphyrinogen-III decarboxylase
MGNLSAITGFSFPLSSNPNSTPAEVEDAAREAIDVLGPGGGLILGPGCALGHTAPLDNIRALIEAAWTYGVYNPDGTLRAV